MCGVVAVLKSQLASQFTRYKGCGADFSEFIPEEDSSEESSPGDTVEGSWMPLHKKQREGVKKTYKI